MSTILGEDLAALAADEEKFLQKGQLVWSLSLLYNACRCTYHSRVGVPLLALEEDGLGMAALGTGAIRPWKLETELSLPSCRGI